MKLTSKQVAQYQRDGFYRFGPLLSVEEISELKKRFDNLFAGTKFEDPRHARVARELRTTESGEAKDSIQQLINVYKIDDAFEALIHDPRILDVTESLIGANIQILADQALLKPALHGGALPWHQDNAYFNLTPPDSVTCWIALTDVTEENSPVRFLPGSHKNGLIEHKAGFEGTILREAKVDASGAVTVTLPVGGASWHHCDVLHQSQPNRSPRPRPAYAIQFFSASCRSTTGDQVKDDERNKELRTRLLVRGKLD